MLRSRAPRFLAAVVTLSISAMTLAGCGSGEKNPVIQPISEIEHPGHHYAGAAYQSPNYHPYVSGSHVTFSGTDTVHVGGDYEPRERLQQFTESEVNGHTVSIFMGPSRDGVGVDRISNYENDLITQDGAALFSRDGFYPFRKAPIILVEDDFDFQSPHGFALLGAVKIVNDVLPPEFQMGLLTRPEGIYDPQGTILVQALPASFIQAQCSPEAAACASVSHSVLGFTNHAVLRIPNDFIDAQYFVAQSIIMHELLHALGIWGHVDHIEFPDSIMGSAGEFFPNWSFVLRPIDREVLQIIYMSQLPSRYNSWDEWSDTSLHLVGEIDDFVRFGAALFNGLPQPWATGTKPDSDLADNLILSGQVSWSGPLLGFSGVSAIGGQVQLDVALSRLDQPQDFRVHDLYFLNRGFSEDRWFPTRNIDYEVDIVGNGFFHSSDAGHITGWFLGDRHEGIGGTIKRADLVGAFGATR